MPDPPFPSTSETPPPLPASVDRLPEPRDRAQESSTPAAKSATQPTPPKPAPESTTRPSVKTSKGRPIHHVAKPAEPLNLPPAPTSRRILVHDSSGKEFVTRLHAQSGNKAAVLLPDGQIGWPDRLVFTESPFVPATADEIAADLINDHYKGFHILKTAHYVLIYNCSKRFAEDSSRLLESLYNGLAKALVTSGIEVHEAEFPLVAIIYATEGEFRARSKVGKQIQAYYEVLTNRIYFHEKSQFDQANPEVAAMRRPQTVAHEGTHQILHNIGVQPRLSPWPLWIVEGLAEYCAPTTTKKGAAWAGVGKINALHMATIRDLGDQMTLQYVAKGETTNRIGRDPRISLAEYLATRTELSPTDYALAWGLTHYLINRKKTEFIRYLKDLSKLSPMEAKSPRDHLDSLREVFGLDLGKIDRAAMKYLGKLQYEELPYYAVLFRQPVQRGVVRKAVLVSQSPSMIRQWVEKMTQPAGDPPQWEAIPHPTRTRASLTAKEWMQPH